MWEGKEQWLRTYRLLEVSVWRLSLFSYSTSLPTWNEGAWNIFIGTAFPPEKKGKRGAYLHLAKTGRGVTNEKNISWGQTAHHGGISILSIYIWYLDIWTFHLCDTSRSNTPIQYFLLQKSTKIQHKSTKIHTFRIFIHEHPQIFSREVKIA